MGKRKMYNTTLDVDLLDLRQNDLIEQAIQDLIKKYKNQDEQEPTLDPAFR